MTDKPLKKLTLCIDNESKDEVSIIFADPSSKDLRNLIGDDCVLNLVRNLLWPNKHNDNSDHANEDNIENVEIERDKDKEKEIDQVVSGLTKEEIIDDVCEGDLNEDVLLYNDEEDHIDSNPGFVDLNDDFLDSGEMEIDNDIPNCNGEGKIKAEIPTFESEDVKEADTINENDLVDLENLEETINPTIQVKSERLKNVNVRVERLNFLNVDHYIHNGLKLLNVDSHIQDGVFDVQDFILKIDNQIKSNKSTASDSNSINSGKVALNSEITETDNKSLDTRRVTCDVCKKEYFRIVSLNWHMKKFHKKYYKEQKRKALSVWKKYKEEQRKASSVWKASKQLTCAICDKVFKCRANLNEHKIWHTGVKPFSCDICDKVFNRRDGLKEHKIWHSGEKPFSCDICDKKYSQKRSLNQHKKIHVESGEDFNADEPIDKGGEDLNSDEPIYKGGEDLKAYESTNKGGSIRKATSEKVTCDICHLDFASASSLDSHMRSKENRYFHYISKLASDGLQDLNADEPINKGEDLNADEPINKCGEEINSDDPRYVVDAVKNENDSVYPVENFVEIMDTKIEVKSELFENVDVQVERLELSKNVDVNIYNGVFDNKDLMLKLDNKLKSNKSTASDSDKKPPKSSLLTELLYFNKPRLAKHFNLSTELAAIVGAKEDEKLARSEIFKRLWAYIKAQNLQDPANKQFFTPDKLMAPVFGKEKIKAFTITKYLKTHLSVSYNKEK